MSLTSPKFRKLLSMHNIDVSLLPEEAKASIKDYEKIEKSKLPTVIKDGQFTAAAIEKMNRFDKYISNDIIELVAEKKEAEEAIKRAEKEAKEAEEAAAAAEKARIEAEEAEAAAAEQARLAAEQKAAEEEAERLRLEAEALKKKSEGLFGIFGL